MSTAHVHSFSRNQRRALGWSTARRCTYGLNVYLQAVDHTTQRITVHAEILGRSNLITLLLLQDCKNEALFELTHRLRVPNAILVHMHYEIFELNFHDELSFLHSSYDCRALEGSSRGNALSSRPEAAISSGWHTFL